MIAGCERGWVFGLLVCGALVGACSSGNDSGAGNEANTNDSNGVDAGAAGGSGDTGSAGMDGSGGSSGMTGDGQAFMPAGDPITAPDGQWTWIDFPDSKCRDGSMAGIAVSLQSASKKVMIYLEGGGACFDPLTCGTNPSNVAMQKAEKTTGLFDRSNAQNPVKDWNFVYVPFCTGDVHLGTKDDGNVDGVGPQHFVGRLDLQAYLNRVVPTFPDVDQVLLTGVSAGGFGASANAEFVQSAFGDVPVTMLDDSGPTMSDMYIPPCLQDKWRTLWGLDDSVLKDCGSDCPDPTNYEMDYLKHVAAKSQGRFGGLIETTDDMVITLFFGYGQNDCTGSFLTPVDGATFQAGLLDFRAQVMQIYPNFGTYFINGTQHTWLGGASMYTETVGGTSMVDWVTNIVQGTSATQVGP